MHSFIVFTFLSPQYSKCFFFCAFYYIRLVHNQVTLNNIYYEKRNKNSTINIK